MDQKRKPLQERMKLRREARPKASNIERINALKPLAFEADTSEIDVSHVHVFQEQERIALSFLTQRGSVNVLLAPGLAKKLAAGIINLTTTPTDEAPSRPRIKKRRLPRQRTTE
jgi:hypothetical protein